MHTEIFLISLLNMIRNIGLGLDSFKYCIVGLYLVPVDMVHLAHTPVVSIVIYMFHLLHTPVNKT